MKRSRARRGGKRNDRGSGQLSSSADAICWGVLAAARVCTAIGAAGPGGPGSPGAGLGDQVPQQDC